MNNFEKFEGYDSRRTDRERGRNALGGMNERERRKQRRMEELYKKEQAKERAMGFAKKVGALALAAVVAVGIAIGSGETTNGIMNTERAEKVETIQVESITIYGGPNLRGDPRVTGRENPSNIIMDLGDGGQKMLVPYRGDACYYNDGYDVNGGWYGFPVEVFADVLYKNSFIGKKAADKMIEGEGKDDGWVWINENYVQPESRSDN